MSVRAKFYVKSKHEMLTGGEPKTLTEVKLAPVYVSPGERSAGNTENEIFGKATPQGEVSMTIANKAAADRFELGKAYYVDFTPAD